MSSHDLEQRLGELRHGDHLCMLYDSRTEQVVTAASVIKYGLIAGDRCGYVGNEEVLQELIAALTEMDVEVEREQAQQRLLLLTEKDAHLRSGRFDPHEMIEFLRQSEQQALANGFPGLRIAGDMSWALGPEQGCDRIMEYESLLNQFYPNSHVVGICQYDRQRFTSEIIGDSLRTHPGVLLNERVCHNFYYEPPEVFNEGGGLQPTSKRVDWMVSQLELAEQEAAERSRLEEQLRTAEQRKSELLGMLSHELRNPLVPVRSGLDLLAIDADDHRETIGVMQEQVERVVGLVDDLVDVARITHDRFELQREVVELATLVNRSVAAVQPLVNSQQQELSVSLPEHPLWLNGDPVRIAQMIENVLTNAVSYTGAGGEIDVTVKRHDDRAVISVRDTGIGIEKQFLPSVFELFTQATRSPERAPGGLGIGLTLVRQIAELHAGSVSATSEGPGHGSRFVVQLPVAEHESQKEHEVDDPTPTESRHILIADDHKGTAWVISKLLNKLGDHEIETAHDGPSALAKNRKLRPEIILLDIGMPGMNGWEVGRAIRQDADSEDVLLIALTAYSNVEDQRKSREAGFDEHLVKPASIDQMKRLLTHPKLSQRTEQRSSPFF